MRIHNVKHSQTELSCGKCNAKIRASRDEKQRVLNKRTGKTAWKTVRILGDSYRWIKFNRGPKLIRCTKPECCFRPSDMTRSDKLSRVYAAQEAAQDTISGWGGGSFDENADTSDLKQALEDCATEVREVAQEYRDSAENIRQSFSESPTADECDEKADELESWADELEGADFEEFDATAEVEKNEDEDEDEAKERGYTEWEQDQREVASNALGECPV